MATSEIVITTREYFLLSLAAALPAGLVAAGPWFNGLLLQGVAFFIVFTVLLLLGLVLTARTKRRRQMPAPRKPTD